MDTPARSKSPSTDVRVKQEPSPPVHDKISAYYSLVFPHFTFYVQTLSVTIGRRCAPNAHASSSSTAEPTQVDVDLGALKSVSRLHAKIEYDHDEDRFVLAVIGRNGAWVDGVWCANGTRTSLGERSQIQIASRVFQFILPPPPPPEASPSPSSLSSGAARHRSPSLDIETVSPPSSQPPNSPPPIEHKLPSPPPEPNVKRETPQPKLPNSNSIYKSLKAGTAANTKKRKKGEVDPPMVLERPKPEDMPPKPPFTYAQLIYKAIKAIGGKATLQEICTWISHTYDYYKYADSSWTSSVRHNLSSGRAFLKMERCGGDRGKGFFWSLDEKHSRALEEQESKAQQAAVNGSAHGFSGGKDGTIKGRKKDKSVALPPPLTNIPLTFKTSTSVTATSGTNPGSQGNTVPASGSMSILTMNGTTASASAPTTGVFAYPSHPQSSHTVTAQHNSNVDSNPYSALTRKQWSTPRPTSESIVETSQSNVRTLGPNLPGTSPTTGPPLSPQGAPEMTSVSAQQSMVPDVVIPIVLGPIPQAHPDYSPSHRNNSLKEGYMVLHERRLILDPDVFSGLTPEMLTELERLGARAALTVLTGHMVRALKERRAREREKSKEKGAKRGRAPGRGARKACGETASPSSHFADDPLGRSVDGATQDVSGGTGDGKEGGNSTVEPSDHTSPFIVVVDSDDEGPAAKKRKVKDGKVEST